MLYKEGVSLEGVQSPTWYAVGVATGVFAGRGFKLVVTSLTDGVHPDGKNIHGRGFAVDIRTRDISPPLLAVMVDELKSVLYSQGFDVVPEGDPAHLHIEWDPKPGRDSWQNEAA